MFVAFVPLFFCLSRCRASSAAFFSFTTGVLYYAFAFRWTGAFHPYAIPFISIISSLSFVMAPALCIRLVLRRPLLAIWAAPSIWVAFEYIKQIWFLRFPFGIVGYSQYNFLSFIQIAELGGVALVSWFVLFINTLLYFSLVYILRQRGSSESSRRIARIKRSLLFFGAAILFTCIVTAYGVYRLRTLKFEKEPVLKIGFAQTLFHPRKTWAANQNEYLQVINDLGDGFDGLDVDLVLFSELTVDRYVTLESALTLEDNVEILNGLSALADRVDSAMLFGGLELKRDDGVIRTYNSAFLFSPSGEMAGVYRKRARVPFGEVNPFSELCPSFGSYLRETTDAIELSAGDSAPLFSLTNEAGTSSRFGVLICFEGAFGKYAREYVFNGADFLVNATNDYWPLSTEAMYQHALMSVFRAIETRTPVLRISNGGFSCYVDEKGCYSSSLPVNTSGMMTSRLVKLVDPPVTPYVRFGDWFSVTCLVFSSVLLLLGVAGYPRRKGSR